MRKATLVVSVLLVLVAFGCEEQEMATSSPKAEPEMAEAPAKTEAVVITPAPPAEPVAAKETKPEPAPSKSADEKQVLAYVNGKSIYMAPLLEMLIGAYGMDAAQHLIASELVQ